MRKRVRLTLGFCTVLLLALHLGGCSATTGYAVYFEDVTRPSEAKVSSLLVIAEADSYHLAFTIETKVVEQFKEQGVSALAYSGVIADTTSRSIRENLSAVLESGVDGIVSLDVRDHTTDYELVSVYEVKTGMTRQEYQLTESITIACAVVSIETLEPIWTTMSIVKNSAAVPWLSTHEKAFSHTLVKVLVRDGVVVPST